ncbi:pentapeptide repeat-containing protein [Nodosilinea sp. LEGE 07088]|uniref:WD40 domain-containing protein n=1 Tax=Nodosilinea sp. LEGE 07088 TaxID=2777968 RepID=UPI0018820AAA|nr:NB-ARC domain-containing protein [Nodosilinea sp. LEGE 07088]MBE9138512.1 pentapeptide repeat-containing protein [Nodosilinea sp. LEGE 07088]
MITLKASSSGRAQIKQARLQRGWAASDFRWMAAASRVLGTDWETAGVLAAGISEGTWKRFLAGKVPINAEAFRAYCEVLGLDWQTVAEGEPATTEAFPNGAPSAGSGTSTSVSAEPSVFTDWGSAPDDAVFYGRQSELHILRNWVLEDRCRLITLLGMGGIGKTALSVRLARQIVGERRRSGARESGNSIPPSPFTHILWRSLRNAPPPEDLLADLIQVLSQQQERDLPPTLEGRLARLLHYLRQGRCLILLDNAESILQSGDRTGRYRSGFEGYGDVLRCIAETAHQSCAIVTSREKPKGLAAFEGETLPVRSLQLSGLEQPDSRALFDTKGGFQATEAEWQTLATRYGGNPLALKIVASSIRDFFGGDIAQFLAVSQQGGFLFDDIRDLLDQHFQRLTELEKAAMYWLAINREPSAIEDLQADLLTHVPPRDLWESLNSLQRRSLVERNGGRLTQQPVVMEYVTCQLIDRITDEIADQRPHLLISHALTKAQAKDYLRETQINLILKPIADQLVNRLGRAAHIATALQAILTQLRGGTPQSMGYAGGNSLNLLLQLPVDITGYDFSELTVWQAYLQDVKLHGVNFAGADLSGCVFTESLGNVLAAAFSPKGQRLATGDTDCQVRVWDSQTGQLLLICRGHQNWVRAVVYSPCGELMASCGADQSIRLWTAEEGIPVKTLTGHNHEVFAIAFSPDGQTLASAGGDNTVKLWDVQTGNCLHTLAGHTDWVRSLAFAPHSIAYPGTVLLASGGADYQIKLWDAATGECLQTLKGHSGWVHSLAFNGDGHLLVSGSGDGTLKLWDCRSWDCLATYSHGGSIYSVAFSPTEDWLISGSGDRTIKLWDWHTDTCLQTLYGHQNEVCAVAVHPDGRRLVGVSLDQSVKLWDVATGHCLRTWEGHTDWALPVAFSPDGRYLASGSNDKTVVLWDWRTGEPLKTLSGHGDFVYDVAFSADGTMLASGSTDCTARLWDVETGRCIQVLQGHEDWINAIAFHPCDRILATASADRTVKLWNCATGQCLHTLSKHTAKILGVAFSPDGQHLASCGADQTIQLWEVATGLPLQTLTGHDSRVWSVAYSPDGRMLASSSTDQSVRLWDVATGDCIQVLRGHSNWVFAVAFSPDGKRLASAAHDHTLRIWDAATGDCLQICEGHQHLVSSLAFSADGGAIATGSQDQTVRIWDAQTGDCLRVLIAKRLYEGMNLAGATGLTPATRATLQMLGAIGG